MKRLALLLIAPALFACSDNESNSSPSLLGYQDCRVRVREQFIEQGLHPTAADMKSKSACEEQFKRR